jgi:hypothetical protein
MNRAERFLLTLDHEEPDRVPLVFGVATPGFTNAWLREYEEGIDEDDIVYFCGSDLTMAKQMGFDAAWAWMPRGSLVKPEVERFAGRLPLLKKTQSITTEGRIQEQSTLGGNHIEWYVGPGLPDLSLWLDWFDAAPFTPVPSSLMTDAARQYRAAVDGPRGGLLPLITMDAVLETIVESLGFAGFARACKKNRGSLEQALERVLDIRLAQAGALISAGVQAVVIADDSAYKDRTYISPELHRELVVPRYEKLAKKFHQAGVKFLLHSDGFTEPYFPGFIEAGIDGIVTIETAAGMDLGKLKRLYGGQLSLVAPVDCSRLLSFASPDEIEKAVIDLIALGARDGGFVMGPCTSFLDTIPLESAQRLVDATMKHGQYPALAP